MGIFSKIAEAMQDKRVQAIQKATKIVMTPARVMYKTFTEPLLEAALTPVATIPAEINTIKKGGKTGEEGIKLPLGGEITPAGQDKPMRLVGKTVEVATTLPGSVIKGTAKAGAKATQAVAKAVSTSKKAKSIYKLVGETLVQTPEEDIYQALAPTTKTMKKLTEKITPEILERGISGTRKSLQAQAKVGMEKAGEAFDELGKLEGSVETARVLKPLVELKDSMLTKVGDSMVLIGQKNKLKFNALKRMISDVEELGDEVPAETLRVLRKSLDSTIKDFSPSAKDAAAELADKTLANSIRKELAKDFPDFAKINKEYTFFKSLDDILEATATRKVGQTGVVSKGLSSIFGGMLGSVFGAPGVAAGAATGGKVGSVLGSAAYKTLSAKMKKRVIDALVDPKINPEKIADYVANASFGAVKLADFARFVKEEAQITQEELKAVEEKRLADIEKIRQELMQNEGGNTKQQVERDENAIEAIRAEMRRQFNPQE